MGGSADREDDIIGEIAVWIALDVPGNSLARDSRKV
jgi:hypothetical protein